MKLFNLTLDKDKEFSTSDEVHLKITNSFSKYGNLPEVANNLQIVLICLAIILRHMINIYDQ